jgi:hypothetical protein
MMFLRGQRRSGDLQRRSLAAGGGDKGGEARSKRDGDGGTVELTEGGGRMAWQSKDGAAAAVRLASADTRPGTERRGTTGCSCRACKGGREGEKKGAGSVDDAFYRCGGRQGKERGGPGWCLHGRERRAERWGA